jgi:peptide/nickel transport system permease protein
MSAASQAVAVETPFKRIVSAFFDSRIAMVAFAILVLLCLVAVFAPWIAPQNPFDLAQLDVLDARLRPGSMAADGKLIYLLGTDAQGRDMLSAILYGIRISVVVGTVSTVIALGIGLCLGLVAGYCGGKIESFIMRVADVQLSFPPILIALILLAMTGQGVGKIIVALVTVQWAYYARTARSAAIIERRKEYIEAAIALGLPPHRVVFRHLLRNCMPPLIVIAALQVASAISLEATLSFLGLGLPVTEPSLGLLIANGFEYLLSGDYWISFFPGLALLVTIVVINLVADQLRDILNPRLQVQ